MNIRIGPATIEVSPARALDAEQFECCEGSALIAAGANIERMFLPHKGLVAILERPPVGAVAGAGLVGAGGVVGYAAVLGPAVASGDSIALSAVSGVSISAAGFRREAGHDQRLWSAMGAYATRRIASTERLCACVALHSVEQRLARWLLQASDLLGADRIDITHRRLADVHGVRRASVTTGLHMLEGERAIVCQHRRITVRDKRKLAALSCGCEAM
ncbi:Crp/Fnr family transcriptional regulator [Chelatococcus sambhunathii]|uniref:Crp/Fnr family transcriptional regulator n=1 Tax=Chelatococcus sambhunathii TaxID=363953 RepID=A0ABU1DGF3_9HYPH|nr:Crp/Fnr family transcriptional regulator [Chelatococcus sambhunathii]MDR4307200.1 Crp/Fnr family transcriptional regulator [Chelatococcus sambhunathii]